MSTVLETAVIALGVNGLAGTGALVYAVRRLAPWPKPPAPQQPGGQSRRAGQSQLPAPASVPADSELAGAANGTAPAGGTS